MKIRLFSCGSLAMIATSVLGFAQEEISAEELIEMVVELPKIIVSAPRFPDVDIDVPARVQLIDRATIQDSDATDLVDLLGKEGNLHFRSTSGNSVLSEVSLGGFGENSGQRVLVLLDGHRLNTADLGQINWLSIPLSLVESIEVIKGGQSALYGNNAVGGVIKIKTTQPQEKLSGQFQTSGGSFDSYNTRLGVSGKVGSLGFSAHAEHDETDGYRENSQYEADGGGVKFDWLVDDRFRAHFSVSGVDSEYGLPGPLSRAEMSADPKQSMEVENFGEEEALYYRGGIGLYFNEELSFDLDAGHTTRDVYAAYQNIDYYSSTDYEIFSLSPTLTYENDRLTAIVGLDYYDDQVGAGFDYFGTVPAEYERQTLAAFTSLKYHLAEDLTLAVSLRGERARTDGIYSGTNLDEVEEEQHAWSIGLVRKFDNQGRAYASARRYFRYPATDEILVYYPSLSFTPDLDPEWGYEVELGGDLAFGAVVAGGRVYNQWMHDEIIFNPSTWANINLDETSRYGADLFATWTLTKKTEASVNYSYVHAEIDGGAFDGSEVPLVAEQKLRAAMVYRPSDPVRILAGATYTDYVYVSGDFDNAESELSDYLLFDLSARYALSEEVSAFVTVDNLFDKKYVSAAYRPDAFYPGVGRGVKVGVTWRF